MINKDMIGYNTGNVLIDTSLEKGAARLKLLYSGLCGSDMHKLNYGGIGKSDILGHELVGEVIDLVQEDVNISLGDIVAVNPLLPCHLCSNCMAGNDNLCLEFQAIGRNVQGGFTRMIDVPIKNIYSIGQMQPKLAVLNDVVAVCLHAIHEFIEKDIGKKKVLIIGDGSIGLFLGSMLKKMGAESVQIYGRHSRNVEVVRNLGIDLKFINDGQDVVNDYDIVYETVGGNQNNTIDLAIQSVKVRGKLVILGVFPEDHNLVFNNRDLFLKEASFQSSVAYKEKYFQMGLETLQDNPWMLNMITQEFQLPDFDKGVEVMRQKSSFAPVIKVIFEHN